MSLVLIGSGVLQVRNSNYGRVVLSRIERERESNACVCVLQVLGLIGSGVLQLRKSN